MGDRAAFLAAGRDALAALGESRILAVSSIEETPPLGGLAQDSYLNQMVALETELAPLDLLARLQRIERAAGRERAVRWAPRTLDLDIVCFETQCVNEATLVVPHPELPARDFWQRELAELRSAR